MEELIRVLRTSELSKELKLLIVTIVTWAGVTGKDAFKKDFIDIIVSWDKADNLAEEDLKMRLSEMQDAYTESKSKRMEEVDEELERIEQEYEKTEEVENLKKSILEK